MSNPHERLRHHVTGAIERGEAQPVVEQRKYRCPDNARHTGDVVGCGAEFEAEPDEEGLVDCPHCGIFFNPAFPGNSK